MLSLRGPLPISRSHNGHIIRKIRMDMFVAGAVAEGLKEAAERILKGENPFNTAVDRVKVREGAGEC